MSDQTKIHDYFAKRRSRQQGNGTEKSRPVQAPRNQGIKRLKPEPASPLSEKVEIKGTDKERSGTQPPQSPSSLPLGESATALQLIFRALDSALVFQLQRGTTTNCTFERLKKPVEMTSLRNFTMTRLAQLIALLPSAYTLKVVPRGRSKNLRELAEGPDWPNHELAIGFGVPFGAKLTQTSPSPDTCGVSVPSLVEQRLRQRLIKEALVTHARGHYREFLAAKGAPIPEDLSSVTAWAHGFTVSMIPEVVPACLPTPPQANKDSASFLASLKPQGPMTDPLPAITPQSPSPSTGSTGTALSEQNRRQLDLERSRSIQMILANSPDMPLAARRSLERTLASIAKRLEEPDPAPSPVPPPAPSATHVEEAQAIAARPEDTSAIARALSVVERVRAREAARKERDAARNNPQQLRRRQLLALPGVAGLVHAHFTASRLRSCPLEDLATHLSTRLPPGRHASTEELTTRLRALAENFPDSCNLLAVRGITYFKIKDGFSQGSVMEEAQLILEREGIETPESDPSISIRTAPTERE